MILFFRRVGRYQSLPALVPLPSSSALASLASGSLRWQSSTATKSSSEEAMTKETLALADALVGAPSTALTSSSSPSNTKCQTLQRRMALAKAITLIESKSMHQMRQADLLMNHLARIQKEESSVCGDTQGSSFRIGISGPPGAGKSTFIESFGKYLLDELPNKRHEEGENDTPIIQPNKVAVVCIDPSSTITGGSILGDKTRMTDLSRHPNAYVRPSPSKGVLGGVSNYTNDVVNLCQAAGYDLVIVESVGIGQSEVDISKGVDMLILMVAPGGGDGLQGVKKGILEVSDMLIVNKADGDLLPAARSTASEYKGATHLFRIRRQGWETPPVLLVSAETGLGLKNVWDHICRFRTLVDQEGELKRNRAEQARYWMWKRVQDLIIERSRLDPVLREKAGDMENGLDEGTVAPRAAAWEILEALTVSRGSNN